MDAIWNGLSASTRRPGRLAAVFTTAWITAILHAEAERQAAVLRAEGEAEAIMKVQTALADSIKLLNNANPNDQVVKLKALESFEKAADGQATKIIVPSEIQSLAGLAASFKGLLEDEKK